MNSPHLSAEVEIAAQLRERANEVSGPVSTSAIIDICFPGITVTGHDGDPALVGMLMRACGHVILYHRDLSSADQRVRITHALAHLIFDGNSRDAACTHRPDEEARAHRFVGELLVPFNELAKCVFRWPDADGYTGRDQVYLDQLDQLGSHFGVPPWLIDQRIRELRRFFATQQNL